MAKPAKAGVAAAVKRVAGYVIALCTCNHAFQDREHGKGMRVKNMTGNRPRCTVCGRQEGDEKR
jgi:hypothetical protein